MMKNLYQNRFEIFLSTLLSILFGSLIIPAEIFEATIMPLLFLLNIISGILLISKRKKATWFFIILFLAALFLFGTSLFRTSDINDYLFLRLGIYFLFYTIVTINIITQVWRSKNVNKNVIIGLMSGYICLGLIGFFLFLSIELWNPESFKGLLIAGDNINAKMDALLYYSFITMMSIGYGEIIPITPVAQKAAILTGLMGQFYIVIITAVVVEKYIKHSSK